MPVHPLFGQFTAVGRRWRLGGRGVIGRASWQDIVGSSTEKGTGPHIQPQILVLVAFLHFYAAPQLALSASAIVCRSPPTLCLSLTAFLIPASEASPQCCAAGFAGNKGLSYRSVLLAAGNERDFMCKTPRNSQTVERYPGSGGVAAARESSGDRISKEWFGYRKTSNVVCFVHPQSVVKLRHRVDVSIESWRHIMGTPAGPCRREAICPV